MIGIVVPPNQGGESGSPSVLVAVLAVGAILLAVALRGWYCDQCRFNFFMMEGNPPCETPSIVSVRLIPSSTSGTTVIGRRLEAAGRP
jgi:hypothetical protein